MAKATRSRSARLSMNDLETTSTITTPEEPEMEVEESAEQKPGVTIAAGASSSDSVLDVFKTRFNFDEKSNLFNNETPLDERFRASDDDFPPFSFDFERVWEEISMEDQEDDYEELFKEVEASVEEPSPDQMHYYISQTDILEGLKEDGRRLQYPPVSEIKGILGKLRQSPKQEDDSSEGSVAPKKIKVETETRKSERILAQTSDEPESTRRSSNESEETQLVLVIDKSDRKKKVVSLRKGEPLPEGLELASVEGDVAQLPDELSGELPISMEVLQGEVSRSVGTSHVQAKPRVSSRLKTPVKKINNESASSSGKKSGGLAPLSDLMTAQYQKQPQTSVPSSQAASPQQRHSRLVYKQRGSSNPDRIASLFNQTAKKESNSSNSPQNDLDIIPIRDDTNRASLPNQGSFRMSHPNQTNKSRPLIGVPSPPIIVLPPLPKLTPGNLSQTNFVPVTTKTADRPISRAQEVGSMQQTNNNKAIFKCKCDQVFLCYDDHLFKKHLLIVHNIEMLDGDCERMADFRVSSLRIRECRKCHLYILNTDQHRRVCPEKCEFAPVVEKNLLKHGCGVCRRFFSSRYELRKHIEVDHTNLLTKVILYPKFRCAKCLKLFAGSVDLIKHAVVCAERGPKPETIHELARSYLECDICHRNHSSAAELSACYTEKDILKCALCFDIFKDKHNLFKHLHTYHGLQLHAQPKLTLLCPICIGNNVRDPLRGRYQEIFPHIVSDHFQPTFIRARPPPSSCSVAPTQQSEISSLQGQGVPKVITVVGNANQNLQVRQQIPDLKPIPKVTAVIGNYIQSPQIKRTTTEPQSILRGATVTSTGASRHLFPVGSGIVFNTTRITPTFPPPTSTAMISTTAAGQGQFTSGPCSIPMKNIEGQRYLVVRPVTVTTSAPTVHHNVARRTINLPTLRAAPIHAAVGNLRLAGTAPRPIVNTTPDSSNNKILLGVPTTNPLSLLRTQGQLVSVATRPSMSVALTSTSAFTVSTASQPKISSAGGVTFTITTTSSSASKISPVLTTAATGAQSSSASTPTIVAPAPVAVNAQVKPTPARTPPIATPINTITTAFQMNHTSLGNKSFVLPVGTTVELQPVQSNDEVASSSSTPTTTSASVSEIKVSKVTVSITPTATSEPQPQTPTPEAEAQVPTSSSS